MINDRGRLQLNDHASAQRVRRKVDLKDESGKEEEHKEARTNINVNSDVLGEACILGIRAWIASCHDSKKISGGIILSKFRYLLPPYFTSP
jgi:hypothetical protein